MNYILDHALYDAFANASDNTFVYVTDIHADLTRWSKRAVEYFGLEGEYIHDTQSLWLTYVHPDDQELFIADISAVFSGASAQHNCQYRVRNRFGEYVWVECRGAMIPDSQGKPMVFAGIMTRLDNQTKYDNLTHLLTGYMLLSRSVTSAGTLMLLGIDNLRSVNSQHGLLYGNRLILSLANTLETLAGDNTLYRYWGDEFVVYGQGKTTSDMITLFRKVQSACAHPNAVSDIIPFSVAGGIVPFAAGDLISERLSLAELCLAHAKKHSRSHFTLYSKEIAAKLSRKGQIAEALNQSIHNRFDGFYLVFQPIVSGDGSTVLGCEALLRWNAPKHIAPCYPDEFIGILEENGGIVDVGRFVMEEVIRHAVQWQSRFRQFYVSFNVSYVQLQDADFIPAVLDAVETSGVDPSRIVVELTENVLASDTELVRSAFAALKDAGIRVALDDFGRGNSSFWMLHHFAADILKLDQAFIRGLDGSEEGMDYAIVESVALLCKRIGCKTIAEGVETAELQTILSKYGFTGLQGYHFSRPVPKPDFEKFLLRYHMEDSV